MSTITMLRVDTPEQIEVEKVTDDELLRGLWSRKDSLGICENAVKTAPSDRSKAAAIRNKDKNQTELNTIKIELKRRGAKSVTRKEIIF